VPILEILVVIVLVGLVLWAVQRIPMDPIVQNILRVVVVVLLVVWLLRVFGLLSGINLR
jgi:type IV secretory pathway TrbL component